MLIVYLNFFKFYDEFFFLFIKVLFVYFFSDYNMFEKVLSLGKLELFELFIRVVLKMLFFKCVDV